MRVYKFVALICVFALVFSLAPMHASAYSVGEDIEFDATNAEGIITGTTSGSTSSSTSSSTGSRIDAQTQSRQEWIQRAIQTTNPRTRLVRTPTSYVITYRESNFSNTEVEWMASTGSMNLGYTKLNDRNALDMLGNIVPSYTNGTLHGWRVDTNIEANYRTITAGGHTVHYITDYEERMDVLNEYFSWGGDNDTYDLVYVCEYVIGSRQDGVLYGERPINWPGTDKTHFWEMECFDFNTGASLGKQQKFSNHQLTQAFYRAGNYHVTATQQLAMTSCSVATWSRYEYIIEPQLGLVLWASSSRGSNLRNAIDPDRPLNEQLGELAHELTYNVEPTSTSYLTQLDMWVPVTSDTQDTDGMNPVSPWGESFDTERIE